MTAPTNPHPCCWADLDANGAPTRILPEHLGPVEDEHEVTGVLGGVPTKGRGGYRVCQVCGARHYFIEPAPVVFGVTGRALDG